MKTDIGKMILKSRTEMGLTQDRFARKYNVSGSAICRVENTSRNISLGLWVKMAKDMGISEREVVMTWVRSKLPGKFQSFVTLRSSERGGKSKAKARKSLSPDAARKAIVGDRSAPKGLKQLLKDNDVWALYKPKTGEIEILQTVFGKLGGGSKSAFLDALRLIREFGER